MESFEVLSKRRASCLTHHVTQNGQTGVWVTRGSGQAEHEHKKGHVDFANVPTTPTTKSHAADSDLKEIGILYGGSLIASTIIGPGIFTSPKGVLEGAGSVGLSLVIWAACGVFSTLAALCFTELRGSVKKEGVEYAYISEAFGPVAAFVYCWMRIAAAEPVGTAVFCVAFSDYVTDALYDGCGPPETLRTILAITALISLALLNAFSYKLAEQVQFLATVGKVTALAFIIAFGLLRLCEGNVSILERGFEGTKLQPASLAFAVYNGLWAYGGWANVNHVTRGVRNSPKNLPRLVLTIIPLVSITYMLVVTSYFSVLTKEDMLSSNAIGVTWGERMLGRYAAIIPVGVGLTALGSANGTFLTAGRLSGVAVKDGNMPEVSSWIHVRSKTNVTTLISRAVIASMMIMVGSIGSLVRFFVFTVWVFHGLSILALLVLRVKNTQKKRPYKVNIVIPIIVVGIIGMLTVAPFLGRPNPEFISSLVLLTISLLFYLQSKYLALNPMWSEKLTIFLQLFLRIAPRSTLRISRRLSQAAQRASIAIARRQSVAHNKRLQEEYMRRHSSSLFVQPEVKRSASSLSSKRRPSNVVRRNVGILKRSQTFTSIRNSVRPTSDCSDTFPENNQFDPSCDSKFNVDLLYNNGKPRSSIGKSKTSFENLRSSFDKRRTSFEKLRSNFGKSRTSFDNLRSSFDKPRSSFENLRSTFDKPRKSFQNLKTSFGRSRTCFMDLEASVGGLYPDEYSLSDKSQSEDDESPSSDAFSLGFIPMFSLGSVSSSSSDSSSDEKQYESASTSTEDELDDSDSADELGDKDDLSFIFLETIPSSSTDDDVITHMTRL